MKNQNAGPQPRNTLFRFGAGSLAVGLIAAGGLLISGPGATAQKPVTVELPTALASAESVPADRVPASLAQTIKETAVDLPDKVSPVAAGAVKIAREGADLVVVPQKASGGLCFAPETGGGGQACVGIPSTEPIIVSDLIDGKFRHTVFAAKRITDVEVVAEKDTKSVKLDGGIATVWTDTAPVRFTWGIQGLTERGQGGSSWTLERE